MTVGSLKALVGNRQGAYNAVTLPAKIQRAIQTGVRRYNKDVQSLKRNVISTILSNLETGSAFPSTMEDFIRQRSHSLSAMHFARDISNQMVLTLDRDFTTMWKTRIFGALKIHVRALLKVRLQFGDTVAENFLLDSFSLALLRVMLGCPGKFRRMKERDDYVEDSLEGNNDDDDGWSLLLLTFRKYLRPGSCY